MKHREETTLNAINALRQDYPYACSLIIYGFIEQEMKFFLARKRKIYKKSEIRDSIKIRSSKKGESKAFREFTKLSSRDFYYKCLKHCTLGTLERLLWCKKQKMSNRRNRLVHLNEYNRIGHTKSYNERIAENKKTLNEAIEDLIFSSRKFFEIPITPKNGKLMFKT